ncbi:heparinase II/III domain-containing protein [Ornithinimicrobium murale]|uniref:heparinase II/III domain-containing protein n=1 Tax=Ornithinimicrobium murale TaxID=1050153 RepID=UPI000E0DF41E|nr:heparinase II/III family protein [Ornithinimicrobium murale]
MTERVEGVRPSRELVDRFVPVVKDQAARQRAEKFLTEGIIAARDFPDISYDNGLCWAAELPRAHGRHLHGLLFLADWHATVLSADQAPPATRQRAVTQAAALVLRWSDVADAVRDSSMAYHDETTAQRLLQVCRLLDDHAADIDPEARDRLVALATSTAELLVTDEFYAGVNNHGMFQDLALFRFAASGDWLAHTSLIETSVQRATERLLDYFTAAFTPDGVHVENSPAYHFMVARSLRDVIPVIRAVGPSRAAQLEAIYRGAERFAVHSIMPDGTIAPLGDTKVMTVARTGHSTTFPGQAFRYAITRGKDGEAPAERSAVFSRGGYAMHRTGWGDADAYVMTFKAAYLAQYHHHCDDLALTLFGRGRWLLSEAGPNGYDYKNPLTKYAYSQHAHNVVLIDGRSLPRVDKKPGGVALVDRTNEPAPSQQGRPRALSRVRALLGRAAKQAAATRSADPAPLLRVTGTNTRFAASRHERTITVTEPAGHLHLTVEDTVEHQDGQEHDHEVLWHVGPGVEVTLRSDSAELTLDESTVLTLTWSSDADTTARLVKPRATGRVQAMRFPRFGRHELSAVISIASRGPHLRLVTSISAPDQTRLT